MSKHININSEQITSSQDDYTDINKIEIEKEQIADLEDDSNAQLEEVFYSNKKLKADEHISVTVKHYIEPKDELIWEEEPYKEVIFMKEYSLRHNGDLKIIKNSLKSANNPDELEKALQKLDNLITDLDWVESQRTNPDIYKMCRKFLKTLEEFRDNPDYKHIFSAIIARYTEKEFQRYLDILIEVKRAVWDEITIDIPEKRDFAAKLQNLRNLMRASKYLKY
jgi:hypothetical protein